MGLGSRLKRLFGRDERKPTAAPDLEIGDLSERLRMMRGNITTPMGPGAAAPRSADSVQQLSKAARDARFVDRSNEDDVLREVKKYRSIDDR
jgi:hypothetical protein